MNTIYSILVSDGAVALHFLLTMVLLVVVILRGIQAEMKLRRVATENIELKRQLSEHSDYSSGCIQEVHRKLELQSDAICHAVDYVTGAAELDSSRFTALHSDSVRKNVFSGPELLAVDLVGEPAEPDLTTAESAFVEPDPNHLEPDVSMPLRASMITMPASADEEIEPKEELIEEHPDIMTRVLQQSRRH